MSRLLLTILALLAAFSSAPLIAGNDSFFVPGTPEEVREAMNQLGGGGILNFPGPPCLKALLATGGVDEEGKVYYQAGGGLLGVARGQLHPVPGGTRVELNSDVLSEQLHRTAVGTPEAIARKVIHQIQQNRRRR